MLTYSYYYGVDVSSAHLGLLQIWRDVIGHWGGRHSCIGQKEDGEMLLLAREEAGVLLLVREGSGVPLLVNEGADWLLLIDSKPEKVDRLVS